MKAALALAVWLVASSASAASIGFVDAGGNTWMTLFETLGLSQAELRERCTPVCDGGPLGTLQNTEGLVWATMYQAIGAAGWASSTSRYHADYDRYAGGSYYASALGATAAFGRTCGGGMWFFCWAGLAYDLPTDKALVGIYHYGFGATWYEVGQVPGYTNLNMAIDLSPSHLGAWLYRPAAVQASADQRVAVAAPPAPVPVPEPATLVLLGLGLIGVVWKARR
jgi:hypothetical protein